MLFKELGLFQNLALDQLPNEVCMYGQKLQVSKLKTEYGILSQI